MSTLKLVYDDKVLFEKEITLSDKQQARATERIVMIAMTNDERIAQSTSLAAVAESMMTAEQKAERALMQSLPREEMEANMLMAQRDSAEQRLKQIVK